MSVDRSIATDAITDHLVTLIENNADALRIRWKDFESIPGEETGKIYRVFRDLQEQMLYIPAVEVVEKATTTTIYGIGTQEDLFEYDILVTVNNNHPELSKSYLRIVGKSIMDLLNAFENRNFKVPKKRFLSTGVKLIGLITVSDVGKD